MQITATRKLRFCAGHRVVGHEGKCAHLHGHDYGVEIHARANSLDSVGRVIDFSVIKERVGGWIDANWDHKTLLWAKDKLRHIVANGAEFFESGNEDDKRQAKQALGSFVVGSFNPTAENIAAHLLIVICPEVLAGTGVNVYKVVVHETPNCFATAEL